jgi:hypothetical protein
MKQNTKKSRRDEVKGTGKLIQELLNAWAESGEAQAADSAALQITTSLLPEPILDAMLARVGFATSTRELYWIPPPGFTRGQWALVQNSTIDELMGPRDENGGRE